jgi:hypothetical protein
MRLPWTRQSEPTPTPEPFDLEQRVQSAVDAALAAYVPPGRKGWPFALDQPHQFWLTTSPRRLPGKIYPVDSLRAWARHFDPLASVIGYLKAEVASIPIEWVAKDTERPADDQVRTMKEWVSDVGPLGGDTTRRVFESRILDDALVVGAYAVWYQRSRGGLVLSCDAIDAATIKPRVDTSGWPDETIPFEQWVIGVPVAQFRPGELRYDGLVPRTDTPYFDSLVERAVSRITAGLHLDEWNLAWLTDGNVQAGDTICLPEHWTPEQIEEFGQRWNAKAATKAGRQSVNFLPAGSQRVADHSRKDQDFGEYEVQVIRRICSLFGVMPASIGYVGEQYKVTQGDSMGQSRRVGVGTLLQMRKEFYDDLARRCGCPDVECRNVEDDWERQKETVDTATKAAGGPVCTVDEARAKWLGLGPMPKAETSDEPPEVDDDSPDPEPVERGRPDQPRDDKGPLDVDPSLRHPDCTASFLPS